MFHAKKYEARKTQRFTVLNAKHFSMEKVLHAKNREARTDQSNTSMYLRTKSVEKVNKEIQRVCLHDILFNQKLVIFFDVGTGC